MRTDGWYCGKCAWCNRRFEPDTVKHRFCSLPCRLAGQKREREEYRRRELIEKAHRFIVIREAELFCDAVERTLTP